MTIEMPREINSEKQVISGMMQSKSYLWNAISRLKAEYFYSSLFGKCFSVMAANKSSDFPMIEKCCEGSEFDPMDFYDTNFSVSGKTEFELIISAYQKREAIKACYNAIQALSSPDNASPTETISDVVSQLSSTNIEQCRSVKIIGELLPAEQDRIERIAKGEQAAFITTGISDIDSLVCIEREDYIPLGGRPSNCKSVLASQICRNLAKQQRVSLYFCLDSARSAEVSRAVFAEAGVSLTGYNRGCHTKKDFDSLMRSFDLIKTFPLWMDNTRKITTDMIYAQCQRVKSIAGSLDLVCIDFMQNIKHTEKNIRERVSAVSEELHNLPQELHCPVMPLSQLSRYQNEETMGPTMKNLKESGDIEEDADKILLVWYPEKYPQNQIPSNQKPESHPNYKYRNLLELYVEKNKNGSTGSIPLTVIAPIFSIYNRSKQTSDHYEDFRK